MDLVQQSNKQSTFKNRASQLESGGGSRLEVVHGQKSRSEERRILPDMLQVQTNIESHLKQLVSSVKDTASALQIIAGAMKDKACVPCNTSLNLLSYSTQLTLICDRHLWS